MATAEDHAKALAAEWGTYVALGPIYIDGVRAFNKGHAVPASHVDSGLVSSDEVAKTTTKAGKAATGQEA